jgi:hypothetical protein
MEYKKIIMNIIKTYILIILLLTTSAGYAATVLTQVTGEVHAKDVFIIEVSVDTEGQKINAIEGDIFLGDTTGNFEIRDVTIAGSGFTLWPRKPSLSARGDTVSFMGGVPGGVVGPVSLFKIVIFAKNPSELRVTPKDIVAYVDDGKGTAVSVKSQDMIVGVLPPSSKANDAWRTMVSTDNIAPEIFDIVLYQDPTLYEGKKFLSFSATDGQSGIAYYEVQEDGALPVRTGDQYVLVNQDATKEVVVTAYDIAGNARAGTYVSDKGVNWSIVGLGTLILLIIFYARKMRRKK